MTPRRRKEKDSWLPTRVYRGKSAYEWHPKSGGAVKLLGFKKNEDGTLIEDSSVRESVLKAHEEAMNGGVTIKNMEWLIGLYTNSIQFKKLASSTKELDQLRIKNRIAPVFGAMLPDAVKKAHIRKYMDKVGVDSISSANRDHGFLSRLFSWAEEHGHIDNNPCTGVTKFYEEPRDRYIEDWEYQLVARVAAESKSYKWLEFAMEFAYLCRMRIDEVLSMDEEKHILPEGVFVNRGKGSKSEITLWSDRLSAAYDGIKSLTSEYSSIVGKPWLFKDKDGIRITMTAYKSAWRRVRKSAMTEGTLINGELVVLTESFNFHDIKAKGVTDHVNKESGHRSRKMKAIYDRKPNSIVPTR